MADMFNGTPVFEQISPTELRITGVTLSANTAGTIGASASTGTPDIRLPDTFVLPIPVPSFNGKPVPLRALVKIDIEPAGTGPFTNLPPTIHKTGDTPETFQIEVTNTKVDETTQELEIYLTLLGQAKTSPGIVIDVKDSPDTSITVNVGSI